MKNCIIANSRIIQQDRVTTGKFVVVQDCVITAICESCDAFPVLPIIDAKNNYLCPGLVELHIHGCGLHGFETRGEGILNKAASFLAMHGVTTFVPTMQCDETAIERLGIELDSDPSLRAAVPGIYIEGPFINPGKKGGIQDRTIALPDPGYFKKIFDLSHGFLKLMTIAPELPGIDPVITAMRECGVIPCLGHSNAQIHHIPEFLDHCPVNITHLFNAMSPVSHRESGLAMLPFLNRELFFELNADCIHLNRECIAMAYSLCNRNRLLLITDAVISAGLAYGRYSYYDKPVVSGERGVRYQETDVLVGSNCLILDVVKKLIAVTRAPVWEAIKVVTLNPARLLGLGHRKGSIEPGMEADLILLDDDFRLVKNFTRPVPD